MRKSLLIVALLLVFTSSLVADFIPIHGTIGMLEMPLVTKDLQPVGTVQLWNRSTDVNLVVAPAAGQFLLSKVYMYLDTLPAPPLPELNDVLKLVPLPRLPNGLPIPLTPQGAVDVSQLDEAAIDALLELLYTEPLYGEWPYKKVFKTATANPYILSVPLTDLPPLQFGLWGEPWVQERLLTVAVLVEMKSLDTVPVTLKAWAMNPNVPLEAQSTGWSANAFAPKYELQHPKRGQFVGPVHGLGFRTPTHFGTTGSDGGGFWYYPGERIAFFISDVLIGEADADSQVSPLDVFPSLETEDVAVVNLARFILSMDADGNPNGSIDITPTSALLPIAMGQLGITELDFSNTAAIDGLIVKIHALAMNPLLVNVPVADAQAWVEKLTGAGLLRRNVSKPHGQAVTPPFVTDKPKMEIMPIWMTAKRADGSPTVVEYKDDAGNIIETRNKVKPLLVTYQQEREPAPVWGKRRASDIFTAISLDDGATWKKFNVSRMAWHSSFTLKATGEKFPGDCRSPQMKVAATNVLVVWTSAYARGGKPAVSIKTNDDYPHDDAYAVRDFWGVRGTQGSVDYNLDKDVGDQGIGEIPYYALWACRGVLVWEGNAGQFPGREIGEIVWFKPERLTTGRRDAFIPVVGAANGVGFGIAWQEDPGGLRPGQCMAGGHGWSGATVHKKTDIWYSYLKWSDFPKMDNYWEPQSHADEHGEESHSLDQDIVKRPKWMVPFSLPVRVSDNNTVNTDNMKVELDSVTGLPKIDPLTGTFIPLLGAEEEDWVRHEHEHDGECGLGEVTPTTEENHQDGEGGSGGGWGMARYAYMLNLWQDPITKVSSPLADISGGTAIWENWVSGEYRPTPNIRWYRFVNQPGAIKTVAVTPDGRVLDGDTGACRPNLNIMPGGWAILGYEETKGLGEPPEGEDHHELDALVAAEPVAPDSDDSEINEKGKDVIYHSFKFDQPDMVSAGNVVNLPALNPETLELIPISFKNADGSDTGILRQYATENARRVRFVIQSTKEMGSTRTPLVVLYKQGVEGNGKPSDIFAVRARVPDGDSGNPYRFNNLVRYNDGSKDVAQTSNPGVMRGGRRHMNMSSVTVEETDPLDIAMDNEGHYYGKVSRWNQYSENLKDESFANPYSDAKGHRGFITGDNLVIGYSFTPNWGRKGGDSSDFYVRRSFDGGKTWKTHPAYGTEHTVIRRDPFVRGLYYEEKKAYGPNTDEPARNLSLLKGNSHTVGDPRLVEPMGKYLVNPSSAPYGTATPDDIPAEGVYYVAYGVQQVLHGQSGPPFTNDLIPEDIYYTRTTDDGSTWLTVPWVVNPNSSSPSAGETVYRFPWLAHGSPYQGHAQLKMHPSGSRLYAIWHQWTDEFSENVSPHDVGDDIWFRRIDFMTPTAPATTP